MGTSKTNSNQTDTKSNFKLTPNGNRLYEFTKVSDEDVAKLRVKIHAYLV